MYDPNDAMNSMMDWSKRALAMKQMNKRVQSAGVQPLSASMSGIGVSLGPKGSKNNPWMWWESDGEAVKDGDFAYERPEEGGLGSRLQGSRGDKWQSMDLWREQQQNDRNGAVSYSPEEAQERPKVRNVSSGSLPVKSFPLSGGASLPVTPQPTTSRPSNPEPWFSEDQNERDRWTSQPSSPRVQAYGFGYQRSKG